MHTACPPPIRCQRTPLLPKRTRLTHICFQPRKTVRGLPGTQIPAAACGLPIRLANRPVAAFVVASMLRRQPKRQRVRTALPGGNNSHRANAPVFAFAKTIAQNTDRLPPARASAFYLQPTPPLRRLKHACDTDAPGTNPAAVAVPALVSFFVLRVPWVSRFPCVAITFLGAAARPSYLSEGLTDKVESFDFRVRIQKIPLPRNGCLSPGRFGYRLAVPISASTLSKLTGKPSQAFRG
jgi:hypothetical protein